MIFTIYSRESLFRSNGLNVFANSNVPDQIYTVNCEKSLLCVSYKMTFSLFFFPANKTYLLQKVLSRQFFMKCQIEIPWKIKKTISQYLLLNFFTQHADKQIQNSRLKLVTFNCDLDFEPAWLLKILHIVSLQLAFFINLQRAVIGPSATLTGR